MIEATDPPRELPASDGLPVPAVAQGRGSTAASRSSSDGLLDRVEVIESQPLAQRAAGFDQLAEELLAELQRSDGAGAASRGAGA